MLAPRYYVDENKCYIHAVRTNSITKVTISDVYDTFYGISNR